MPLKSHDLGRFGERLGVILLLVLAAGIIRAERLPLKIYTSADGLGSSFVDTLRRDSRGFMWFATRDGLSRFDGSRFVTYQVGAENAATGIESIYETRSGVYWIGTTRGFYRFRADAMANPVTNGERPILNAEFVDRKAGHLLEDRQGNLWLGGGDLYRIIEIDGRTEFQEVELNLPEMPGKKIVVSELWEAADGCLWIRTPFGIIRRLPDGRTVFYPYGVSVLESLVSLMIDAQDRLWLTIGGKLYILKPETIEQLGDFAKTKTDSLDRATKVRFDAETLELPDESGELFQYDDGRFFEDHQMKFLLQTSDGHIWISTSQQLAEFDGTKPRLYPKIPGTTSMRRMGEDMAGNLWISGTQHLIRLDRQGVMTFDESDGLKSSIVYSLHEDAKGRVYIATGSYFVTEVSGGKFRTATLKIPSISQPVWTGRPVLRDSRGEFWMTSTEGLYRFAAVEDFAGLENSAPIMTYGPDKGLKAKGTYQIFEDSRGDIWVSTRGDTPSAEGLARFDRSADRFVPFTSADGYPDGKTASTFAEDADGNIWIGFYQGGIARFRDGRFEELSGIAEISSTFVTDLLFDKAGRLWVTSPIEGIFRIDHPNSEYVVSARYTIENGLSSNNIRTLTADHLGNIYAGTVRGVDRIAPETGSIRHFSVDDGLASDFVVDSLCDRDGKLWFATMNGLSMLTPSENRNSVPPPVWIGAMNVAGVPQAVGELGSRAIDQLEFKYTQNNFQIEFFALDFAPNETIRYQYKLEGTSTDWSRPSDLRTINFASLAPGDYRLLIRSVNDSGLASDDPAIIVFKINQPFWRAWWFLAVSLAIFFAVLYLLYLYRTRNLRRVNQALTEAQIAEEAVLREREKRLAEIELVRTRIATDLHDDIGSSLTQIAVLSEVARNQAAVLKSDVLSRPLELIKGVSRELVETMSDVVWAINPRKDNLADLVQRMRRFALDLCVGKSIHFELDSPPTEDLQPLGANLRREVFAIFKEAVNNSVKYSECKNLSARFRLGSDTLHLEIHDDGRGFDTIEVLSEDFAPEKGGNGLVNMRRRAEELGGKCRIESNPGAGTKIFLDVPLGASDGDPIAPTQSGG